VARGEAGPDSDVDLLAELDPDTDLGFGLVSLIEEMGNLVGRPVGLAFSSRINPALRARIARDLIPVF
jgi:predicted nucleotidyltransferase